MNEIVKTHIQEIKGEIVAALETNFPLVPLFEDEVPEEETKKYDEGAPYYLIVMKMGAFEKQDNKKFLSQPISIDYYSENRDDVDETTLDIISVLKTIKTVSFTDSDKFRARHANSNRFVDVVSINFSRMTKLEC